MRRIILSCTICWLILSVQAQIFEDQSKLQVGYQRGMFIGNESFNSQGTIAPSFYANFKTAEGLMVTQTNRVTDRISLGVGVGYLSMKDWKSPNHESYNGSRATQYTLQPVCQYHTPYREAGIYQRLKIYGELAPAIGYETVNLSNYPFVFENIGTKFSFSENSMVSFGYQATLGGEYALTNILGLYLNVHFSESFTKSPYYVDTHYSIWGVSVGTSISLSKIKRFNY